MGYGIEIKIGIGIELRVTGIGFRVRDLSCDNIASQQLNRSCLPREIGDPGIAFC